MHMDRRSFLSMSMGLSMMDARKLVNPDATNLKPRSATQLSSAQPVATPRVRKIAIEEAFVTTELLDEWQAFLATGAESEPGFKGLYGSFLTSSSTEKLRNQLLDVGADRIHRMDEHGINIQVLSVTAPGVQMFERGKATAITQRTNDRLAGFVSNYPDRYIGLAAIAPQDPLSAAKELERSVKDLNMRGAIINSHTQGEYLDHPKFLPIFAAAQSLDIPIYLHPRTPSPAMLSPYLAYGLEGAGWGFAAETSLHAVRLILSGLFDRFPTLKIILGHLGEGIPFWLARMDRYFSNHVWTEASDLDQPKKLEKTISQYFMDNFVISTSGMNWSPAIKFVIETLGADRLLFAVDYPYESIEKAVAGIDSASLSAVDREKICYLNAERLFKINSDLPRIS